MRLQRRCFAVFLLFSSFSALCSCGVKLPPVAPEREQLPSPPANLNCSPSDETCDKADPNYQPRKR